MFYKFMAFVALFFAIFTEKTEAPIYLVASALFCIANILA